MRPSGVFRAAWLTPTMRITDRHFHCSMVLAGKRAAVLLCFFCCAMLAMKAAPAPNGQTPSPATGAAPAPGFNVRRYVVEGSPLLPTNVVDSICSRHTGPNLSREEIVKAASDLQLEYVNEGYPPVSIAFRPEEITNGMVTLNVFEAAIPQIIISGERWMTFSNGVATVAVPPSAPAPATAPNALASAKVVSPANFRPAQKATAEEKRRALVALKQQMVKPEDHRVHVVSAAGGPRFAVKKYLISGNTILSPSTMAEVMTNIDGAFGTNVSFDGVKTVVEELQQAYHERGYDTVVVTVPQQKLTNATVKLEVLEGRISAISIVGNNYFSSNNIMRALPSLHTNIVIDARVLEAELNRANANQDRQILPLIGPGPMPGTSALTLRVKDRVPLHAKVDLDNENSPGTPDLRVNASAVDNNLWQHENSVGFQYGFSPEEYKRAGQWNFYDRPDVSLISGFYRMPLGHPQSLDQLIAANPGSFGYSEASRKFNLPPVGGMPDFTVFASRSTIDTGTADTYDQAVSEPGKDPFINREDVEHSPTINEDIAGRLDYPLATSGNLQSSFSGGLDFKIFDLTNYKTNIFTIIQTNIDANGNPVPITGVTPSIVPTTVNRIEYLPLSIHYTGTWRDSLGISTIGVGLGANLWCSSLYATTSYSNNIATTTSVHGKTALADITGSTLSSGYWLVLNPSYSRTIVIQDWTTLVRMDGQWASEPLISPEQFGAGGVNSVRGYPEGDAFGDDGWHFSIEQQTPAHTVGMVYGTTPLTLRGSVYMDSANVYLIDPEGRPHVQSLWGAGLGFAADAGSHWQAQFLFSFPLISTPDTPAYQPRFDFSLTAQF